ncbi:MAG: hypothetical protein AB4426_34875 [Xenococcaceae cyanobacterium]
MNSANRKYYLGMFTFHLNNGKILQVPLEKLEQFLEKNREQIQVQHKKMGSRRAAPVSAC